MVNSANFTERLRILMEHYGLSASAFADRIGVQRSGISHILAGRNKPSLDFVLKIVREFESVDLYWLLLGKGSFPPADTKAPEKTISPIPDTPTPETHIVPKKTPLPKTNKKNESDIAKIIILYENGSFDSFEN